MRRTVRQIVIVLGVASAFVLGGCASTAGFIAGVATEMSSSTPGQVKTLGEAYEAATLVATFADAAVLSGKLDRPTLLEIQALRGGVRTALGGLQTAQEGGKSLDYAAIDAALQAWNSYMTVKGLQH